MASNVDVFYKRTKNDFKKRVYMVIFIAFLLLLTWLWFLHAQRVKRNGTERKDVLIYAPARSGSSFLGQIFNQHKDVFYLYEPLYIYTILDKLRVLNRSQLQREKLTLLQDCFQCNFTNHKLYLYFISNPGYASTIFRDSSKAMSTQPLCKHKLEMDQKLDGLKETTQITCQNRLEAKQTNLVCRKHEQVTTKVLSGRIKLSEIFKIINNKTNLKIIHLLRDPRAIIASRLRLGWISKPGTLKIREFCNRMSEDLQFVTTSTISRNYVILRYEDLVTNVFSVVTKIFQITGLNFTNNIEKWLQENTRWPGTIDKMEPFSTTKRNALRTAHFWRKNISLNVVRIVEDSCKGVMKKAGYKRVTDLHELRNQTLSLLVQPTDNINQFLL